CDAYGLSAAEYNPKGAAAAEIAKLYVLVQAILRVTKPDEDPEQLASPETYASAQPEPIETLQPTEIETLQPGTNEAYQPKIPEDIVEIED
ncbi:MAG: hypothetical protein O7C67_07045, partial [Gammaproteobacteria bacterium]|nr:hypothetical protein [Gammaproteobacteria bacterium]